MTESHSGQLVEKEVQGDDPAVPGNDDISPGRARDPIDLVTAAVDSLARVVEHAIVGEDLVDGRAPAPGSFSPKTS